MVVTLAVLMESQDPQWTCSCEDSDHWHYVSSDEIEESESHLQATGHTPSCKRTDRIAKIMEQVYGIIFPDQKFELVSPVEPC
ncbi:hypothetical protein PD5205_00522 [Xanthomonas fragariae]|uniref:Uncharacterized protein n=2 Tax=Xanthomonas fragariae TaxID=48664 RepID=A0A1Y6HB24_9XANT|nr:hypothetical protein BER92_02530 [Xanthomonas fragariae]ENZ96097.1 hypothetical protein O1K_05612 [Xanthomonas fragariae LMG 25863]AOD17196.1 hypothetical protein BER93_02535 [Xanthomonas fragariae]SMQ96814.1 hypothetical protein NBC2815_03494 [Xanthomonas fragariae]SMR00708.1 hypothetical protein PD885_03487 [Xanthomonas fragariae]